LTVPLFTKSSPTFVYYTQVERARVRRQSAEPAIEVPARSEPKGRPVLPENLGEADGAAGRVEGARPVQHAIGEVVQVEQAEESSLALDQALVVHAIHDPE
jgi:hypothetical protein